MADPFVAEIRIFPFNFAPKGWAWCDGQLLPLSQNTALFSLLGTTYGGNGKSNFALPDLQGRAPMHPGQGPGLSLHDLGETGGTETVSLLESEIPSHSHTMRVHVGAPANLQSPASGRALARSSGGNAYQSVTHSNLTAMAPESLAPSGGDAPHNNMQPYSRSTSASRCRASSRRAPSAARVPSPSSSLMKRRTFCKAAGLAAGSLAVPSFLARAAAVFDGAAAGVLTYGVQVATDPGFAPGAVLYEAAGLPEPRFVLNGLHARQTYYWRANISDGVTTTEWSDASRFETAQPVSAEKPDVPAAYELGANYPNPFNPRTTVPFTVPEAGFVDLRVYNQLGQEVAVLVAEHRPAGAYEVAWDASGLASGMYVCTLRAGAFTRSRTMVLLK